MEKNIRDYLHLYLGSEIYIEKSCYYLVHEKLLHRGMTVELTGVKLEAFLRCLDDAVFKIVLRPLSDMIDDECLDCSKILGGSEHLMEESRINQARELLCTNRFYNHQTNIAGAKWVNLIIYLLQKGFDLFGLIDDGLAVKK